jgi:hypothetical protein
VSREGGISVMMNREDVIVLEDAGTTSAQAVCRALSCLFGQEAVQCWRRL